MHNRHATGFDLQQVPSWVPEAALNYLAHTETGVPIRALARRVGRHASTVLRQIRAFETRRDDLLVDEALRRLGSILGLLQSDPESYLRGDADADEATWIEGLIQERNQARQERNWGRADEIRKLLADEGVVLEDGPGGTTWRKG